MSTTMRSFIFGALCLMALGLDLTVAKVLFTPLEIDNTPCKPENLKRTNRYICDSKGNVQCQHGWEESKPADPMNPCKVPVCDAGCVNGECRGPDICACEIGWEGKSCNVCVPLPGCVHGYCEGALTCICEEGKWEGAFCDVPSCETCSNGLCSAPGVCTCNPGWFGEGCDQCQALPGCDHGRCIDEPNTCICDPGYEGALCDKPVCEPECINGECTEGDAGESHFCLCSMGWEALDCGKCQPYWECPNKGLDACRNPNECLCDSSFADPKNLCNHTAINTQLNF